VLREEANRYGTAPGYRMDIEGADAPRLDPGPVPGPVLILHRGEQAEITVVNRMTEPTAIHWHGVEIDSYFDGVPGFGGTPGNIAQPIAPGSSFVVRVAPPRAGTFIYHTHWHGAAQLAGGLYGALLVLEPGERFDPATDHVAVIGLNGVDRPNPLEPFALNGRGKPAPIQFRAGVPNRLRLINITATNVALVASLSDQNDAIEWRPLAKDGADVPQEQSKLRRARQPIAVGETYDFEVAARGPQNLWLEVRRGSGEWVFQAPVQVR
jgi:FtsP/CotA-like multicopper oxidase with cupredoxin domain